MKSLKTSTILLLLISICSMLPAFCNEKIIIDVDVNIHLQPLEMYIDGNDIPMMKKISGRQWEIQNQKYIKEDYIKLSKNAILEGNYKKALQYASIGLEYVAPLNNNFGDFYRIIGFAYFKQGDYIKSLKNYNIAIENYKLNNADIYYERGLVRNKICDYYGAKEDYNKSIKLDLQTNGFMINGEKKFDYTQNIISIEYLQPTQYFILPTMVKYGKLAFISEKIKKGELEKVLDFYAKRIENDVKLAETYNNRGVYFLENYDIENAINDFKEALKVNQNIKEAYFNLALAYYTKKEYTTAQDYLTKYLEKNEIDNYCVGQYGTTMYKCPNNYNDFIIDILNANINIKMGNSQNANLILKKYKINNFSEESAENKLPMKYLPLLTGKSYQYFQENKYKKARNLLYEMLTADYETYAGTYKERGKYYYLAENPTFNINKGYEVVENAYIFNNMALLEYLMGRKDLALEDIQKAKEISFKNNNIDLYKDIVKTYNFITAKN